MIRVIRIIGESFDLESGKETPKSLLLSNGLHELAVPISDDVAHAAVVMMLEVQGGALPSAVISGSLEDQVAEVAASIKRKVAPTRMEVGTPEEVGVVTDTFNLGEMDSPGGEYDDELTGVESL